MARLPAGTAGQPTFYVYSKAVDEMHKAIALCIEIFNVFTVYTRQITSTVNLVIRSKRAPQQWIAATKRPFYDLAWSVSHIIMYLFNRGIVSGYHYKQGATTLGMSIQGQVGSTLWTLATPNSVNAVAKDRLYTWNSWYLWLDYANVHL